MKFEPQAELGVNWKAGSKVIMMLSTGMETPTGAIINPVLKSQDGKIEIKLPPDMFPFLQLGIPVCVTLAIAAAEAKLIEPPKSGLILPN